MITQDRTELSANVWHQVLNKKGYATSNLDNVEFVYSATQPTTGFRGETASTRSIGCNDGAILWIRSRKSISVSVVEF